MPKAREIAEPMNIKLRTNAHVYDVRAKKYLGLTDCIETSARLEIGRFYALMPYEIKGIKCACRYDDAKRKLSIEAGLKVKGRSLEDQVLRVELIDPEGKPVAIYSGNFWTQNGKLHHVIPMALNDKPGKWTVKIMDVVSGTTDQKSYNVP